METPSLQSALFKLRRKQQLTNEEMQLLINDYDAKQAIKDRFVNALAIVAWLSIVIFLIVI